MDSKQMYLAWVRTNYPALYWKALQATFGNRSGLGGLGDDLISSVDPTLSDVGTGAATADLSSDTTDAINSAYTAAQSPDSSTQGGSTDFWASLVNGIKSLAPTVIATRQGQVLVNQNAANAARGLPLYDASGHIIPNSAISPATNAIQQMEAALSGSGGWLGIAVLAGVVFLAVRAIRN